MTFFFGIRRWDAHIIDEQNNKVLVHYVGGASDEDEWIPSTSERLRYADTKLPICKTKVPQTFAMRPSDTRMSMPPLEEEERKREREGGMEGGGAREGGREREGERAIPPLLSNIEANSSNSPVDGRLEAGPDRIQLWEHKLRELQVFRADNGHCCVSQKDKNLSSLGVWVKRQRQQQKKGKLSEEVPSN